MDSARTILVVGTSAQRRARSVDLLARAGYTAATVATTDDAEAYVAAHAPPLVIFDFDPCDADTLTACRLIKRRHPDTFILKIAPSMAEASGEAPDISSCIDAYLADPIDPLEMVVLVRSLLRLQKVEADLRDSEERLLLAQESAGLAILDWVIATDTFIHSANFAKVFDLEVGEARLTPAMLIERIHPEDLDDFLGSFSDESRPTRDFDKEFRIVARDGTIRWIASRGRLFVGADGAPERMLSLSYDITHRKTAERTNAELAAIVDSSIDAIISIDLAGNVTSWNAGADALFGVTAHEMIGRQLGESLDGVSEEDRSAYGAMMTDGEAHEFETRRTRHDGRIIDIWVTSAPIRAIDGHVAGASLIVRDISQQKQREEHIRFLMRELTHRSKNLLAVIQAMARQSLTRDITPEDFVKRFTDRLQGLAGSHDLLSRVDWKGASLMELIRSQLNHYIDLFGTRIVLEGPDISIRPEAAQNVGIALHELSTNAAKYGALSNSDGRVTIAWSIEQREDRMLNLSWRETGGPQVAAPVRRGFGHVVMDRIAGRALGGHSSISFEPAGVVWTLDVPAAAAVME